MRMVENIKEHKNRAETSKATMTLTEEKRTEKKGRKTRKMYREKASDILKKKKTYREIFTFSKKSQRQNLFFA